MPVQALTFNHRRAAFYKAYRESPTSAAVLATKQKGLKGCRMLSHKCPVYLVKELVRLHNLSHGGSGYTFWDMLDHSLDLEEQWTAHSSGKGISSACGS